MNKKAFTEASIRTKFITPAITGPDGTKWDKLSQIREEFFFTNGRTATSGTVMREIPRYYQIIAINRTVDAIGRGEDRILLVMATGTVEEQNIYKQFSQDFFDLIIVDVCHRPLLENQHLLREHRPRRADASGHAQCQPGPCRRQSQLHHADHRR